MESDGVMLGVDVKPTEVDARDDVEGEREGEAVRDSDGETVGLVEEDFDWEPL